MALQIQDGHPEVAQRRTYRVALVLVVSLYAIWGMAHNLNDILITQFRKAFLLTNFQSSLVQSCFYIAYLVAPLPVMLFLQRFGYKAGIISGLCLFATGAFLFWPAADYVTYPGFLGALFVIACGIVFLETAGTGIVVALGTPDRVEWRINLAQAFNPLGAIAGVLIGRTFILSSNNADQARSLDATSEALKAWQLAEAQQVQLPYLVIGIAVLTIAALVAVTRFPQQAIARDMTRSPFSGLMTILAEPLFRFAATAQFFYVGAQIGFWSFLIPYAQYAIPGASDRDATVYLTISLALFLIGRFVSLFLLRHWSSPRLCGTFAGIAALLTLVGVAVPSGIGLACMVAVSFFMAPLYPGIYAIGLSGNEAYSKPASAIMIMTIVAGAILTAAMGGLSDRFTIAIAYAIPTICFIVIVSFCRFAAVKGGLKHVSLATAPH